MCLKKEIQRRFGFTQPVNSVYVGILNSSGIDFVDIDNYVESMCISFLILNPLKIRDGASEDGGSA